MKAAIIEKVGSAAVVDVKEQAARSDYVRVKTVAVAVNPSRAPYSHPLQTRTKANRPS